MKIDTLYKIVQIFSPIIVAFITIWIAQLRWKKDGYLKRKIEIEIELNRKLIGLYTILEKAKSIINTKHQYNEEQILDLGRTLYNLRNILFDKKNDIYKLLNEYSLFRSIITTVILVSGVSYQSLDLILLVILLLTINLKTHRIINKHHTHTIRQNSKVPLILIIITHTNHRSQNKLNLQLIK